MKDKGQEIVNEASISAAIVAGTQAAAGVATMIAKANSVEIDPQTALSVSTVVGGLFAGIRIIGLSIVVGDKE